MTPTRARWVAGDDHGSAPSHARILAQARFELQTLLANGEQLLVSLVLPLGALVGLALTSAPSLGEDACVARCRLGGGGHGRTLRVSSK